MLLENEEEDDLFEMLPNTLADESSLLPSPKVKRKKTAGVPINRAKLDESR